MLGLGEVGCCSDLDVLNQVGSLLNHAELLRKSERQRDGEKVRAEISLYSAFPTCPHWSFTQSQRNLVGKHWI